MSDNDNKPEWQFRIENMADQMEMTRFDLDNLRGESQDQALRIMRIEKMLEALCARFGIEPPPCQT